MIQIDIPNVFIKPYVRMTQKGKFVSRQAQQYLNNQNALMTLIRNQVQLQGAQMYPKGIPLTVIMQVYVHTSQGHRADLDNIVKSVMDASNGIVFEDDRWIDEFQVVRTIGEQERLFMIVTEKTV